MIVIKEIDGNNVFDVCELTTNHDGIGTVMEQYLCCNATSVAQSKYDLQMHPKAIYDDDTLIGFVMYQRITNQDPIATICRFMIDHSFQGKGLGRKAFAGVLQFLKEEGIKKVIIMLDDHNIIAKNLYQSFGFLFTGKIDKEEYYYELNFSS